MRGAGGGGVGDEARQVRSHERGFGGGGDADRWGRQGLATKCGSHGHGGPCCRQGWLATLPAAG
jgi:hypothetical protein